MTAEPIVSDQIREILCLLREQHNVLISGPPGTGKSRLLNQVANHFRGEVQPPYYPYGPIAFPATQSNDPSAWLPSPSRSKREVFHTVFHQMTKYRNFLRGYVPKVNQNQGSVDFEVSEGTLYRASEHALTDEGTSLILIDEINRGPAVQVFGDSIVALEADKRLNADGNDRPGMTQYFELMNDNGKMVSYALPQHLYILAAMNQADTSVEPLDVAFLRRWEPYHLNPNQKVLCDFFGLDKELVEYELTDSPKEAKEVYAEAIRAWLAVNYRISLGRGEEYQLGHGVFMGQADVDPPDNDPRDAAMFLQSGWKKVMTHIDEVFFGDVRGIAEALNISNAADHPFELVEATFAGEPVAVLHKNEKLEPDDLYTLLTAVAGDHLR